MQIINFTSKNVSHKKTYAFTGRRRILAMAGKAMQAPHKAFSAINDADFKFGTVLDRRGNEHELTHGSYGLFFREHDQNVTRKCL